jgi:phage terminase large subunit
MISLDSTCDSALLTKLIDELSTPMRDYDTAGRDMVEGKKDLAKRDVKSPNLADAFIIAASRGLIAGRNVSEWI